jgi:hypothetical protein
MLFYFVKDFSIKTVGAHPDQFLPDIRYRAMVDDWNNFFGGRFSQPHFKRLSIIGVSSRRRIVFFVGVRLGLCKPAVRLVYTY